VKIVRTKGFDRDLRRIGATARDFEALVADLIADPEGGDRVVGLRGVRKIRFGFPSRRIGKSGGGRAIYLAIEIQDALVLLMAYAKNEKADLTADDRKALLKIVAILMED
jgi:hypothetical protein